MNTGLNTFSVDDIDRIKAGSFVRDVEFHCELPSTNDRALELVTSKDLETPMLVLTALQTAGRGRGTNQWWASPGALTFSLVFDATKYQPVEAYASRLPLTTALALHDALSEYVSSCDVKLKWPNDVYIGSRKVAGILLERSTMCSNRFVVGIGVNVNNSLEAAPAQVRQLAISLHDSDSRPISMKELLLVVLDRIAKRFEMLANNELCLSAEWQEHCLLRTRVVSITVGENVVTGVCQGIDDQGALMIQNDTGIHHHLSGVISV